MPTRPSSSNLRSIVAMLVAVGFFALMDAVLKTLAARYPVMQIAALRGLACLPLVLAWITWRGAWGRVKPARWSLHLLRGALSVAMLSLFTLGVRDLPLSAAYTLFFVAPLLITLLSVPVLGERVPWVHWVAVAIGFAGVLVALRPSGQDLQAGLVTAGGLAVLGAALCYAISAVVGRLASRTDSLNTGTIAKWLNEKQRHGTVNYPNVASAICNWLLQDTPGDVNTLSKTLWS